jgi:hypothetical protein
MSIKRKMIRAAQMNIEAAAMGSHRLTPEEVRKMVQVQLEVAGDKKSDPRSRSICANNLLVHDLEVQKYVSPPTQKSEMALTGLPVPPTTLNVRIIGPEKQQKKEKDAAEKR